MTHKELIEMSRIAFILPEGEYCSLQEVLEKGEKNLRTDRQYRDALESILLNYVEPQLRSLAQR